MNLCICIYCGFLTDDHCQECSVALCWLCSFVGEHGHSGLCGVCMRMEHYRKEHEMLPTASTVLPVQLILSEDVSSIALASLFCRALLYHTTLNLSIYFFYILILPNKKGAHWQTNKSERLLFAGLFHPGGRH